MDELESLNCLNLSDTTTTAKPPSPSSSRRSICPNCSRPNPVCLCKSLPAQPIPTKTQIIILHHPYEAQHKLSTTPIQAFQHNLSTTPILTKCLANSTTIINRRLKPGFSSLLDQSPPAIYLFPPTHSSPAVNLSQLNITDSPLLPKQTPLVLIVFDATWKHAKEMVKASEEYLSKFTKRVCLDFDVKMHGGSIYHSELILRKEPFGGCVSTMEAVARTLKVLEPNGFEIESKMIEVLRDMVRLQASYLKPMKLRPKLVKKKGKDQKQRSESDDKIENDSTQKVKSYYRVFVFFCRFVTFIWIRPYHHNS